MHTLKPPRPHAPHAQEELPWRRDILALLGLTRTDDPADTVTTALAYERYLDWASGQPAPVTPISKSFLSRIIARQLGTCNVIRLHDGRVQRVWVGVRATSE